MNDLELREHIRQIELNQYTIEKEKIKLLKRTLADNIDFLVVDAKKDSRFYYLVKTLLFLLPKDESYNNNGLKETVKSAIENSKYEKRILIELRKILFNCKDINFFRKIYTIADTLCLINSMDEKRKETLKNGESSNSEKYIATSSMNAGYLDYEEVINQKIITLKNLK